MMKWFHDPEAAERAKTRSRKWKWRRTDGGETTAKVAKPDLTSPDAFGFASWCLGGEAPVPFHLTIVDSKTAGGNLET
jgi:hypothetical protein